MTNTIAERELRGATLCQTLHWLAEGRVSSEQLTQAYLDAMKLEQSRALWEKVLTDFAVIVCRWQGRGPRAISKRIKENKQ